LKINRTTLLQKMARLGLEKKASPGISVGGRRKSR
jgi:hypothetical protein